MKQSFPLASIGYRAAARIVDLFVVSIVFIVVARVLIVRLTEDEPSQLLADIVVYGVAALYEVIFIAFRGQTPGKMVLKLRVLRIGDREPPGLARSVVRWALPAVAAYLLSSVSLPLGYFTVLLTPLIYLYAVIDPMRQGLHDKAAGTIVVTERAQSVADAMIRE